MNRNHSHTFIENLRTSLYAFLMVVLFALIGLLLGGLAGGLMSLGFIVLFALATPRISPFLVFRRYRGRPLGKDEAPGLYRITETLARRAGLERVPRLFILPVRVMNAFTVGNRRDNAIGITDGLLQSLSTRELTGVLAHEISHLQHNDLWIMNLADNLTWFTRLFSVFGQWMVVLSFPFLIAESVQVTMAMAAGVALLITAPWLSFRLKQALSRTREYQADMGAVFLADDALGLASALQKIQFRSRNIFNFLFIPGRKNEAPGELQSHPETEERIRRLLAVKEKKGRPVMLRDRRIAGHVNKTRFLHR